MADQAERYKSQGNTALQAGQYPEAIELYTKAIGLEPSNAVYFSNRAAAFASLKRWREALDDSHEVVTLKPDWVKGWVRRGSAFTGLGKHEEARKAYLKATQLEPGNAQVEGYLRAAEQAVKADKDKKWEDDPFEVEWADTWVACEMAAQVSVSKAKTLESDSTRTRSTDTMTSPTSAGIEALANGPLGTTVFSRNPPSVFFPSIPSRPDFWD